MSSQESGVSSVVAAVMLVGLFVTAMSIFTFSTLPEWKADKEQVHQTKVKQELSGLLSDLEALAARDQAGPVSARIPLTVPKVPLLQPTAAHGSLGTKGDFLAKLTSAEKTCEMSSSRLVYDPTYQSYPSQDLVFEGGGVVVDGGGLSQGVVAHPSFSMSVENGMGKLNWTLVALSAASAVTGNRDAVILATFTSLETCEVQTTSAAIALTTPTAEGWGKFFQTERWASQTGASASSEVANGKATLNLNTAAPASEGWTINIRIIHAEVTIS